MRKETLIAMNCHRLPENFCESARKHSGDDRLQGRTQSIVEEAYGSAILNVH